MKITKYIILIFGLLIVLIILLGGGFGTPDKVSMNDGEPIIFAHRGIVTHSVENSMDAFKMSQKLGFKAIETDIRCAKDKKLIVFHDDSGKRLLNIDRDISELNWSEIKDLSLIKNGIESTSLVLSVEELLQHIPTSTILYLDVKESSLCTADNLLRLLERFKDHKNIIIADGNLLFLIYLKAMNPKIKVALEGFNKGKEWIYFLTPKNFKPDFLSSFLQEVDKDHMTYLKNNKLLNKRIVYGVNHENIQRVYELGLQNIIFDYDSRIGHIEEIEDLLKKNKYQ